MRLKAEELSNKLPSLYVKADRIANTIWEGMHNRNKDGLGDNFWQFRKYEYGNLTALNNNKRRFECKLTKAADIIDLLKKNVDSYN